VLLIGEPLPADLPPALPMGEQKILADIPAGPAVGSPHAAARYSPGRSIAALRKRRHRRRPRGIFSAHRPHRQPSARRARLSAGCSAEDRRPGPSCLRSPYRSSKAARCGRTSTPRTSARTSASRSTKKAIQAAFREVADGLAARGTYDEQLAAQERYTATQQRSLELAQFRYRNGIDSYLNVLTAQTDCTAPSRRWSRHACSASRAWWILYRALGGGWIERTGDEPRPGNDGVATGR